jgi:hypothetical protein
MLDLQIVGNLFPKLGVRADLVRHGIRKPLEQRRRFRTRHPGESGIALSRVSTKIKLLNRPFSPARSRIAQEDLECSSFIQPS